MFFRIFWTKGAGHCSEQITLCKQLYNDELMLMSFGARGRKWESSVRIIMGKTIIGAITWISR